MRKYSLTASLGRRHSPPAPARAWARRPAQASREGRCIGTADPAPEGKGAVG